MKSKKTIILLGLLVQFGLGAIAFTALGQEDTGSFASKASDLGELLEQVRNASSGNEAARAEREAAFKAADPSRQAAMLKEAQDRLAALVIKSQELSSAYDTNDKQIIEENKKLQERAGNLTELFGVTRQVSNDLAGIVNGSMISNQYPDRAEYLTTLANSKTFPDITELEKLWFYLSQEMTETGRVSRYETNVVEPDGTSREAEVLRIGSFIAQSKARFIQYQPTLNQFAVLTRQPPKPLMEAAAAMDAATSGYVRAPVDPSRGVLLGLTVERPTVGERIERGESVGYVIIAVGIVGAIFAIFQFFYLIWVRVVVRLQMKNLDKPRKNNPIGRMLLALQGNVESIEKDYHIAELRISEAVLKEVPRLERFQSFLRLAVAAGPLLGLIGTVIGMIVTFQSITESGSSDPKLMATGIGQAMIATVLGLGIAIPLLFANAGLTTLSTSVVQVLDEQSAGLLAASIEKRRSA